MKIGKKKYEIPDTCPKDCKFTGELLDQSGICFRCPVMLCESEYNIVPPEYYGDDWAEQWDKFFKGEIEEPMLKLKYVKKDE